MVSVSLQGSVVMPVVVAVHQLQFIYKREIVVCGWALHLVVARTARSARSALLSHPDFKCFFFFLFVSSLPGWGLFA